jgi:hypothetical protein
MRQNVAFIECDQKAYKFFQQAHISLSVAIAQILPQTGSLGNKFCLSFYDLYRTLFESFSMLSDVFTNKAD